MGIPGSVNPLLLASQAGDYEVSRSLRFNSSDSAYLSRTPASAGNRKTWTLSFWVKRGTSNLNGTERLGQAGTSSSNVFWFGFTTNGVFQLQDYPGSSAANLITSASFRDASAWYHWVISVDTTQATAANRIKIYVNNAEQTFSTASYPSQNADLLWNAAHQHDLGCRSFIDSNLFNGYLAEIHFIDGQALTPSSFAETNATTGQWVPKAYTGSYGTNGFQLKFADNSNNTATTLGKDTSGNSNNWTPNNLSVTAGAGNDSLVDTPTSFGTDDGLGGSVRGNYCTLNPLANGGTLSNGNLDQTSSAASHTRSTFGLTTGKWYWEATVTANGGNNAMVGIANSSASLANYVGVDANGWGYYAGNGNKYNNGGSSYGATYTANDVIGVAYDGDNGTLTFYKNGVSQGQAFSGLTSGPYFPAVANGSGGTGFTVSYSVNFGQRPFAYTAPSGFKALCDTNLPAPVVAQPSTVMDVVKYDGNSSTQTISGLGFSPDLMWIKSRNAAYHHALYDTIRGSTQMLSSSETASETTYSSVTSQSSGFALSGAESRVNESGLTYVAWTWDAGSTTASNPDGSITSTVRVNANSGFSVVSWTSDGASSVKTMGHGLGVTPAFIIAKGRGPGTTSNWHVWSNTFSNQVRDYLFLNTTDAKATAGVDIWSTSSTTFGIRQTSIAANNDGCIAYCFAPVAGYSSFGSYTGNGSADGPFVYTGFRPRFILIKATNLIASWRIFDTERDSYNLVTRKLYPNLSNAELNDGVENFDILSNGFKHRDADSGVNGSGKVYIYAAFAESPFQYARAR